MKKYMELEMELIVLQAQDIVTISGAFDGEEDNFYGNDAGNEKIFSE